MSNGNGSGFTMGLVCGAVVGAALGVLFAPKSGAATRRDLARSADGLRLRGMDLYDNAVETVSSLPEAVADLSGRGTEFVNKAVTAAKATLGREQSAEA
jgi:gas vesicle protein